MARCLNINVVTTNIHAQVGQYVANINQKLARVTCNYNTETWRPARPANGKISIELLIISMHRWPQVAKINN